MLPSKVRFARRLLGAVTRILVTLLVILAVVGVWVTQPVWVRRGPAVPAASPARLQSHVRQLSEDFVPRSCDDATNLVRCADYIGAQFAAAGALVSTQRYRLGAQAFDNVIARFGPATGACVVVGAHYDACGRFPAADDNASGVAGLLELAVLLGRAPSPAIAVLCVAYSTEEPPFFSTCGMGSYQHAKALRRAGVEVKVMLALEMIGCFRDEWWSQRYPVPLLYAIYPARGNYISIVGNVAQRELIRRVKRGMMQATDLPIWSGSLPRRMPGVDFSDHRSYWDFDFPAVMITDTAFCRSQAYHQPGDTWDKLDYVRMAKVVDGVAGALTIWTTSAASGSTPAFSRE
jgi:hypothetical protein